MNHTLYAGWWGVIAFFANFYAITLNLINRRKIVALGDAARSNPQLEGAPLMKRAGPYVALGLFAIMGVIIVSDLTTSDAEHFSGKCVRLDDDVITEVSCGDRHDGKVVSIISVDERRCPAAADDAVILTSDVGHVVCLDLDQ